jgi:hypothetical protein
MAAAEVGGFSKGWRIVRNIQGRGRWAEVII